MHGTTLPVGGFLQRMGFVSLIAFPKSSFLCFGLRVLKQFLDGSQSSLLEGFCM
jgi:hypothetical protein